MNKYLGASPGAREAARIAWRERVNAAALELGAGRRKLRESFVFAGRRYTCTTTWYELNVVVADEFYLALSAPRPWRSAGRPTPRRRYSRAHRKGCWGCQRARMWLAMSEYVAARRMNPDPSDYVARFDRFTREPHGRTR